MYCLKTSLLVLTVFAITVQNLSIPEKTSDELRNGYKEASERKKCVCMNWRYCTGKIDSDVQCHPSYVMACCIQPDPELIPSFRGNDSRKIEDDMPQPSETDIELILVP